MRVFRSNCGPVERKPAAGQSVPAVEPEAIGTVISRAFSRLARCKVMQTAAAPGHRRMAVSELPEAAPSDPTGPRFLVEDIYPSVDGGRYPIKRISGEPIEVWADLLREGHDRLAAGVLWGQENAPRRPRG